VEEETKSKVGKALNLFGKEKATRQKPLKADQEKGLD